MDAMSYCVGVMLGDGSLHIGLDGRRRVELEMMDVEVVEFFASTLSEQFSLSDKILVREPDGVNRKSTTYRWLAWDTNVYDFFRDITSGRQHFPEWYFGEYVSDGGRKSLLAGLFDTDGFVAESKHDGYVQYRVGFTNTSQRLVYDAARLLMQLGIRVARVEDLKVQRGWKPAWRINPNTRDFIAAEIPMLCKRKLERLAKWKDGRFKREPVDADHV